MLCFGAAEMLAVQPPGTQAPLAASHNQQAGPADTSQSSTAAFRLPRLLYLSELCRLYQRLEKGLLDRVLADFQRLDPHVQALSTS